jgi:hypothetical protein
MEMSITLDLSAKRREANTTFRIYEYLKPTKINNYVPKSEHTISLISFQYSNTIYTFFGINIVTNTTSHNQVGSIRLDYTGASISLR